jgi:hypothetical protein
MKSTLHLDSLRLTVRGVPAATVGSAARGLGPQLARALAGPASPPPRVSPSMSASALRCVLAARAAQALRPHLAPKT